MTDLILHIGFPKTGTSYIQRHLFSQCSNFIGNSLWRQFASQNSKVSDLGQLIDMHQFGHTSSLEEETKSWIDQIRYIQQYQIPESDTLIISREGLTRWHLDERALSKWPINIDSNTVRYRPSPIASFLKNYLLPKWKIFGNIKIILVLRNQPDWLASLYAQSSNLFFNASQKDFEQKISQMIKRDDSYIDWTSWVDEFKTILGKENVCVLLMEQMGTLEFWQKFTSFMSLKELSVDNFVYNQTLHVNVKRENSNIWKLREFHPHLALTHRWPANQFPKTRRLVLKYMNIKEHTWEPWDLVSISLSKLSKFKREPNIQLTPESRKKILDYISIQNSRLSEMLGHNLTPLGY